MTSLVAAFARQAAAVDCPRRRVAASISGVAVSLSDRAATGNAAAWSAVQRRPYRWRRRGGSWAAVASRWAGANMRSGAGSGASRMTVAISRAIGVTTIVSLSSWAWK